MNASAHVAKYLSPTTQAAFKARASEEDGETPKEKEAGTVSPGVALLKRVERIIFSPNVKTLEEAASRLRTLCEELEDDDNEAKKPSDKDTA
jgi:hypothetical protein